jgi:hypothetical protein
MTLTFPPTGALRRRLVPLLKAATREPPRFKPYVLPHSGISRAWLEHAVHLRFPGLGWRMLRIRRMPSRRQSHANCQQEIDSTVGIMRDNINKVSERGERLDSLQDKTDNLQRSAQGFRRGANRVRKAMW